MTAQGDQTGGTSVDDAGPGITPQRYRQLFDDAPIGQAVVDVDGRIVEANAALQRMLGYGPGELSGVRILDLTHPDDLGVTRDHLARISSQVIDRYGMDKRYVRKDGSTVWARLDVVAIRDGAGQIASYLALVADVSERRAAEERLAAAMAELEERNRDLEQFASVASHDLKTPLQSIIGFLDLVLRADSGLPPEVRLYVERALAGGHRMDRMIDAVLALALAGTRGLTPDRVELREIVTTVRRSLGASLGDTGGRLELAEDATVWADRTALGIILQNLASNAVKYAAPERPPLVQVSVEGGVGAATVRVSDNGRGIAADERDAVFAMFTRASSAEGVTGTGIGLATCQRLVERHGGRMWIEDSPLGGTTVTFTLPGPHQP